MAETESTDRWRYVVLVAKFSMDCVTHGLFKAFGVLVPYLVHKLDTNYGTLGFIFSMELTAFFMGCPLVSYLSTLVDPRTLCIVGGLGASGAIAVSGYVTSPFWFAVMMFLTGLFSSTFNQISYVVLHQYFGNKFAYANSISLTGSFIGGALFPVLTSSLMEGYGLEGAVLCLAGLYLHCVPIGGTLRPPVDLAETKSLPRSDREELLPGEDDQARLSESSAYLLERADKDSTTNSIDQCHNTYGSRKSTRPRSTQERILEYVWSIFWVRALLEEWAFTLLFLPCKVVLQIAMVSWTLFVISFALSRGFEESFASYLPMVGSIGGMIFHGTMTVILRFRDHWGAPLFITNMVSFGGGLLLYPARSSSPTHLLICSFFAGGGMFAGYPTSWAVLESFVAERNIEGIISAKLFITGLGTVISGYIIGKLYDVTGSFDGALQLVGGMCVMTVPLTVALMCIQKYRVQGRSCFPHVASVLPFKGVHVTNPTPTRVLQPTNST
ncbi:monocarboxylate transporter 3-like [Diadema antillarum]|uniref:monocarboxylate transporter 3-like n=1 Tax=Diadema antillarum TaxID=105358 RepID=UPI003A87A280